MTITAWPFAFLTVLALFTLLATSSDRLQLATCGLVVSGVLVTLMANVVDPRSQRCRPDHSWTGKRGVTSESEPPSEKAESDDDPNVERSTEETALEEFIAHCHEALTHQSQGRPEPFLEPWSRADDVTIMAAIGGSHVGFGQVSSLLTAASKTQSFDTWDAENLVTTMTATAFSVELSATRERSMANGGDDAAGDPDLPPLGRSVEGSSIATVTC